MFLSQPPMATRPSKPSQPATVSMESAITSRDTSEYFIPSVPLAMPSEMVMVLKITPLPPAPSAPSLAWRANSSIWLLQGVRLLQVEAMPTWGLAKSASVKPTARSMARLAALPGPSTTGAEWRRRGSLGVLLMVGSSSIRDIHQRVALPSRHDNHRSVPDGGAAAPPQAACLLKTARTAE